MHNKTHLLWYASYGSNALRERFHCYIRGGMIAGNIREYEGCRNTELPLKEKNILIPHELYFAKKSKSWSGGGVGFIKHEKAETARTYGRMYLITEEQFRDVVKQETRRTEDVHIDFEATRQTGHLHVLENVWYGRILYLGEERGHPIFTFTNAKDLTDFNPPSVDYLKTLMKALAANFRLTKEDTVNYLVKKPGISGRYSEEELTLIFPGPHRQTQ